jgi:ferredoxin, 2Fe-2S
MPKIIFAAADGTHIEVEAHKGETVMLAALVGMVPGIEAECGGACSCGTCHVVIDEAWRERTGNAEALEADMLEAIGAGAAGRLACQIKLHDGLDGLLVHVPAVIP